jgi:broad specificity phosphatase PhoE
VPGAEIRPSTRPLILLVRHGRSTLNQSGRLRAWEDPPLASEGVLDAKLAAQQLKTYGPKMIYSSDLTRDTQTAHIIADLLGNLPYEVDFALRTANMGELSGMLEDEVRGRVLRWYKNPWEPAPSGSSFYGFTDVWIPAFNSKLELARSVPAFCPSIMCTHGRNIAERHAYYNMLPPEKGLMPWPGGIAVIRAGLDGMDTMEFIGETECVCDDK